MCGIIGSLQTDLTSEQWKGLLWAMMDSLVHRGPDDAGCWYDPEAGVGLGHRRLSIVDLSPLGHQPMASPSGRYRITYNGEVYNFHEIKSELQSHGYTFRSRSDTEVILAALEEWGTEAAVKRFVGMFAFALWDHQERRLHLVRDRLGIKPLYYGFIGHAFVFSSELKAFHAHPEFRGEVDRNALALMLRHGYVPAPNSIYRGIHKLLPGTILSISPDDSSPLPSPIVYWSARTVVEQGQAQPFLGSVDEAVAHLDALLRQSVELRLVADVPLGAFLSGGIDSSTVVALMQAQSTRPVKTFSIGFEEQDYNEAMHAKAVARHLGTDHTELNITPAQAMAVIPNLPTLYDEPFSDSSQIPTFLVSELARQHVTVSLSGDGGDELFGGYDRYFRGRSIWQKIGWMPGGLKGVTARALKTLSPQGWDVVLQKLGPALPGNIKQQLSGDRLHKLAEIVAVEHPEAMYLGLISHWKVSASLVLGACEPPTVFNDIGQWADVPDFVQRMMFLDMVNYLPDDILVKVDRASMGVGLEARVPMLDHRVVEFAWRLPLSLKINNGQGKWLLRQVLDQYVPRALIDRPKMGFGVPIGAWLRDPLREWAESLLDESRLRQEGFFDPAPIRQKWEEHLAGTRDWKYHLWDVLMFQAWQEMWLR